MEKTLYEEEITQRKNYLYNQKVTYFLNQAIAS